MELGIEEIAIAILCGLIIGAATGYALTMWFVVEPLREERDIWCGMYQDAWDYANSTADFELNDDGDFALWDDEDDELVTEAQP